MFFFISDFFSSMLSFIVTDLKINNDLQKRLEQNLLIYKKTNKKKITKIDSINTEDISSSVLRNLIYIDKILICR